MSDIADGINEPVHSERRFCSASFPIDDEHMTQAESTEILRQAQVENRKFLMEHESKRILENAGIKTTGGMVASSEDDGG